MSSSPPPLAKASRTAVSSGAVEATTAIPPARRRAPRRVAGAAITSAPGRRRGEPAPHRFPGGAPPGARFDGEDRRQGAPEILARELGDQVEVLRDRDLLDAH